MPRLLQKMRSGNETKYYCMALASTCPQARPDSPMGGLMGHTPPSAPRGTATDYGTNQSEQHIVGFTFCHDTQIIYSLVPRPFHHSVFDCLQFVKRRGNKATQTIHAALATASQAWAIFYEQNLCREQAFFLHDSIPEVALSTILLSSLSLQSVTV